VEGRAQQPAAAAQSPQAGTDGSATGAAAATGAVVTGAAAAIGAAAIGAAAASAAGGGEPWYKLQLIEHVHARFDGESLRDYKAAHNPNP